MVTPKVNLWDLWIASGETLVERWQKRQTLQEAIAQAAIYNSATIHTGRTVVMIPTPEKEAARLRRRAAAMLKTADLIEANRK